jgi:hypothetical protein
VSEYLPLDRILRNSSGRDMHPMHWRKSKIADSQNGVGFTERQMLSAASLAAVGTAMTSATAQISQPSYKTGNDPGKPELMG